MMRKIAGIVVTYNRPDILKKCLESMLGQTVAPDKIFVIDNSPKDEARAIAKKLSSNIEYKHFPENIGSEGGYCEGIRLACGESDYMWLLDDDCVSERNALFELINWMDKLEREERAGAVRSARSWDKSDGSPVREIADLFAWRGTLISSKAVKAIGLPEKELFLYAGDTEYGLRMREHDYKIFLIFSSKIHSLDFSEKVKKGSGKMKIESYAQPFRIYYAHRNEMRVYIEHRKFTKVLKLLFYSFKNVCFYVFSGRSKEAFTVLEGIADGIKKKLGKNSKYSP